MSRFYVGTTEVLEFVYRRLESDKRLARKAPRFEDVSAGLREIERQIGVKIREARANGN